MVEGVNVKFRWFRTIETNSNTISLISVDGQWNAVALVWDTFRLLYESGPAFMVCGRHKAALLVDGEQHVCNEFTVVASTFEVNIYVTSDDDNDSRFVRHSTMVNDDAGLTSSSPSKLFNASFTENIGKCPVRFTASATPSPIFEEALAAKNREIADLRFELEQLKAVLVGCDAGRRLSVITRRYSAVECADTDESEISSELLVSIENYMDGDTHGSSLEFEAQQLRARLCSNDPVEVENLLEEMKSLKTELRLCSRKNNDLTVEVRNLRAENARLIRSCTPGVDMPDKSLRAYSMDYVSCYSDPESGSTQYRQLPIVKSFNSLPTVLGSPLVVKPGNTFKRRSRCRIVPRRPPAVRLESPASGSDSESLQTDDLLVYSTPPQRMGSAGVQTDITAVVGNPVRLKSPGDEIRRNLFSKERTKAGINTNRQARILNPKKKLDDDSDDTEELLFEANQFVERVLGAENLDPVAEKGRSSVLKIATGKYTSTPHVGFSGYGSNERLRPFIPKCATEVCLGNTVRYFGPTGLVTQGRVTFVGPLMDRDGIFIGVENEESDRFQSYHSSSTFDGNFVPFKKIIFAWK